MTEPNLNIDYLQQAYDLITSHFKDAEGSVNTNFRAFIKAIVAQIEDLEIAGYDMIYQLVIDNATGDQLDVIGKWVGEDRGGLGDTEYRRYINARIRINKSGGTAEELIRICSDLTQSDDIRLIPLYAASVYIDYALTVALTSDQRARVGERLLEAISAGVGFTLVESVPTGFFGFDGDADALGFGDGLFAGVVYNA